MSKIKSISVGNGDMFYIKHGSDNFTIIDCCLSDENKENIVNEIISEKKYKNITRFISTHPDEDHLLGLKYLDDKINILNFYCVENNTTKEDETIDFKRYCELRDSEKAFYLCSGCQRHWMNLSNDERSHAGLHILWPNTSNQNYIDALKNAEDGESSNNISIILQYTLQEGITAIWMGDLENEFMERIKDEVSFSKTNVVFAPHHGRKTGKIPKEWLEAMDPDIIVLGEAQSKDLDYAAYEGYNKITQNSAGDILFDCVENKVHIFVSSPEYSVDFLADENLEGEGYYIGTLNI